MFDDRNTSLTLKGNCADELYYILTTKEYIAELHNGSTPMTTGSFRVLLLLVITFLMILAGNNTNAQEPTSEPTYWPDSYPTLFRPAECDEATPEATPEATTEIVRFRIQETVIVEVSGNIGQELQARIVYGNSDTFKSEELPYFEDWLSSDYEMIVHDKCTWLQREDGETIDFDYIILAFRQMEVVSMPYINLVGKKVFNTQDYMGLDNMDRWHPSYILANIDGELKLINLKTYVFGDDS